MLMSSAVILKWSIFNCAQEIAIYRGYQIKIVALLNQMREMKKADQLSSEVLPWSGCRKGAVKGSGNREQGGECGNPCRGKAVLGRGKRWLATSQQ